MSKHQPTGTPRVTSSVVYGRYADPALTVFDNTYYLYPTTDGLEEWSARSFTVLSSTDLIRWTDHGEILRLGTDVHWATSHAWAPAVAERHGKYYLYFTAESNIGVAVADSPTGPFEDIGHPLVEAGRFPGTAIDPSVFTDLDGISYLFWGNETANGVRLNDDMVSFNPNAVHSWQPTDFREAITVHRHGDVYYASWSVNDTRDEDYCVRYATGTTPFGPWRDHGILLSKSVDRGILGTGHHSIVEIPGTDDWIIAYHRFAVPNGNGYNREIVFDHLLHTDDGALAPIAHAETPISVELGATEDGALR